MNKNTQAEKLNELRLGIESRISDLQWKRSQSKDQLEISEATAILKELAYWSYQITEIAKN